MPEQPSCANCTKPIERPVAAPHKRFCSGTCRNEWHLARRKKALAALTSAQTMERGESTEPKTPTGLED